MKERRSENAFPIQTFFADFGSEGCLAFVLLEIAQREHSRRKMDVVRSLQRAIACGFLTYEAGNRSVSCFVKDIKGFLSLFVDRPLSIKRSQQSFLSGEMKYVVQKWYNARTRFTHFCLSDYDPLLTSVTKKEGSIVEYIGVAYQ